MQEIDICQSCKTIEFEKYFRKSDILEAKEVADRKDFPLTIHHSSFTTLEESSSRCELCRLALQTLWANRTPYGQVETVPAPDAVVYVAVYPKLTKLDSISYQIFTLEFSVDQLHCNIIENIEGAEDYLFVERRSPIGGKIQINSAHGMLNSQQIYP